MRRLENWKHKYLSNQGYTYSLESNQLMAISSLILLTIISLAEGLPGQQHHILLVKILAPPGLLLVLLLALGATECDGEAAIQQEVTPPPAAVALLLPLAVLLQDLQQQL